MINNRKPKQQTDTSNLSGLALQFEVISFKNMKRWDKVSFSITCLKKKRKSDLTKQQPQGTFQRHNRRLKLVCKFLGGNIPRFFGLFPDYRNFS